MKFSEVVAKVTDLAQVINAYWETELLKRHPKYPLVDPSIPDPPPPPQEDELRQFLRSLPADEVYRLFALASAGRLLSAGAFARQLSEFARSPVEPREVIDEIVEMPGLDEYLTEGLEQLAKSGIALEPVGPAPVAAPN